MCVPGMGVAGKSAWKSERKEIMRYDKGHKETTKRRIVEVASTEFRRNGLEGIGVADVMAKAGLTHGGFYSHFESKEDLIRETIKQCGGKSLFERVIEEGGGVEDMIRRYLRPEHRDNPQKGCPAAALVEEVARRGKKTRVSFTENLSKILTLIESRLPRGSSPATRRKKALAVFASIMGSLQLARAVSDKELSDQILETGIAAACLLAK